MITVTTKANGKTQQVQHFDRYDLAWRHSVIMAQLWHDADNWSVKLEDKRVTK